MRANNFIVIALLAICCIVLSGQDGYDPDVYIDSVFSKLIPKLYQEKDLDGIFRHLNAVFQIEKDKHDWPVAFNMLVWKIHYAGQLGRFDAYAQSLDEADAFLSEHGKDLDPQVFEANMVSTKMRKALYFYETGNWLSATEKYEAMLEDFPGMTLKNDRYWFNFASANLYLGVMARSKGNYESAEHYFSKALECQDQYQDVQEKSRGNALTHKHLGDMFVSQKEYGQAQVHYELAVGNYSRLVASVVSDPKINQRNLNGFTSALLGQARLQKTTGNIDQALRSLQQAEKTGALKDDLYQDFGEVYSAAKDYETASRYFNEALGMRQELYGGKHYKTAATFAALGDLQMAGNHPEQALAQYQQSIIALCDDFQETDIAKNPTTFRQTFISRDLPVIFAKKMDALLRLHEQSDNNRNYLLQAWNAGLAAVAAVDSLKFSPVKSDEDKHQLLEESYAVYEKTLHIAAALGPDFHDEVFAIMEKSKSIVLLEAFHNANTMHVAGISDSILETEIRLKYELNMLEDSILRKGVDDRLKTAMNVRISETKAAYRALIEDFKKNNSNYYQLKYAPLALNAQEVSKKLLTEGQALVEYFVGDSSIFVLIIAGDTIQFKEIKKTFPLDEWVAQMLASINAGNVRQRDLAITPEKSAEMYTHYAWLIYQAVFAPIAAGLPEKLIIIPDGALGYVPFEALLTAEVADGFTRYKTHPYLLDRHEISYCYSAALLEEMKKMEIRTEGVLAMAPAFEDISGTGNTLGLATQLDALSYNEGEAEAVVQSVGQGQKLVKEGANRQAFMALAPGYRMVHVATHGILDPGSSNYSYLAFTAVSKNPDSNRVYVRDLYGLRLNAAMVVLSACKTGLGEIKRGEGVISLAYGIIYSGAQSVIMTLWSVDELSTTDILRSFYDKLTGSTVSKDAALRAAKQEYIQKQKDDWKAHPFFWAAYTPIGDMKAVSTGHWWIWCLCLAAATIIGLMFWRKRRASKKMVL